MFAIINFLVESNCKDYGLCGGKKHIALLDNWSKYVKPHVSYIHKRNVNTSKLNRLYQKERNGCNLKIN